MNEKEFIDKVSCLGYFLTAKQLKQFSIYCDFLIEKNKQYNLTAIKEPNEIYLKHFYDCITILNSMQINEETKILDIGTGAGFPGMVIKIIDPEISLTLLDANNKKITFLQELAQKLNLDKINFIHNRAEEYFKEEEKKFDYVVSRAVANLNTLAELCLPFVKIDGYFISMKGQATEEIEAALDAITLLGGEIEQVKELKLPVENSHRSIIKIKKIKPTSSKYPRPYSKMVKYPLKKLTK